MSSSRKVLLVSLLALACHFVALAAHSVIASNFLEFVLTVLTAAACFQAAGRGACYAPILAANERSLWALCIRPSHGYLL